MEVLDKADEWLLVGRDGELEAVHPVPFDGARYCSTRERTVAAGKTSEYGLAIDDVLGRFLRYSMRASTMVRLEGLVEAEQ